MRRGAASRRISSSRKCCWICQHISVLIVVFTPNYTTVLHPGLNHRKRDGWSKDHIATRTSSSPHMHCSSSTRQFSTVQYNLLHSLVYNSLLLCNLPQQSLVLDNLLQYSLVSDNLLLYYLLQQSLPRYSLLYCSLVFCCRVFYCIVKVYSIVYLSAVFFSAIFFWAIFYRTVF